MYLKSIELQGFKSFANKTTLEFHDGVTGIVGPNGSGKSNVADAVRWVLGEQSAKSLRGGSMQDVIFSGTENRKPLGFAYTAITLNNKDRVLKIDSDSVTVSRRLYRSGESEYCINGNQCRLKDVNELFYDTGIGREGYSIIGQGQVEQILNGKMEDRRALFDEAAGIVKFKIRKLAAQKKLAQEEANLLRVNDILSELTRQLGPLKSQSEKARVYLKKRDELKNFEINQFLLDFQDMKAKQDSTQQKYDDADVQLKELNAQTDKIRTEYETLTGEIEKLEAEQSELQSTLTDHTVRRTQTENQISLLKEQIQTATESQKSAGERLRALEAEIVLKKKQLEDTKTGREKLSDQAKELEAVSRLGADDLKKLQLQISRHEDDLEKKHAQVIAILNDRTLLQGQIKENETLLEQARIRKSALDARIIEIRSEQKEQGGEEKRLAAAAEKVEAEIAALTAHSQRTEEQLSVCQEKLQKLSQSLEPEQMEFHRLSSRLETLKNIAERYDGYGNSIRRVMELKGREPGLLGVTADLIRTDRKYETAIETAMGGSIQNIVTEDEETAKRMIAYLKANKFGRATFLPLTAMNHSQLLKNDAALRENGVIGLASSLVQADKKYDGLVRYLLGRVIVTDTIDHAIELARKYKYTLRIVTLEGESLSAGGSMTGGAFKNSSNLLGRRREIEELEKQKNAQNDKVEKLKETIDETRTVRNRLRMILAQDGEGLQKKYLEQNTAALQLKEAKEHRVRSAEQFEQIRKENLQLVGAIADYENKQEMLKGQLERSSGSESELNSGADAMNAEIGRLRIQEKEMLSGQEKNRLDLANQKQKADFLTLEIQRIETEISRAEDEKKTVSLNKSHAAVEIERKEKQILELGDTFQSLENEIAAQQKRADEIRNTRDEKSARQKQLFAKREDLTRDTSLLEKECYRLNTSIERISERREAMISHMWDEYEISYTAAVSMKREDLGPKSEWKKQISALRTDIRNLGSVNVNAIDEYKELSERHEFMSRQQEDLVKAGKDLEKIIGDLDKGMRTQFKTQFDVIRKEFDKCFRQLFGGGSGSLEMDETNTDILEADIRIIAQPPGKKVQNMMQLSGGEKALTAIALLFAIQSLKPSPFCILDEIEAALDENNVDRFAEYLRKLSANTQFIVITHRRGTMTAADRLYGITMQEKGISTLVSVSLIEDKLSK